MEKISEEVRKVSNELKKISQILVKRPSLDDLVKKPSLDEIPPDITTLPGFKPFPKLQLVRSSSLPRIEMPDRPATPTTPHIYGSFDIVRPCSSNGMKAISDIDSHRGQMIPPNAKKLRVRSFLWVKPISSSTYDTAIFAQLLPVLAANIAALSSGLALGYSAVLLPQLEPDVHFSNSSGSSYKPFTADPEQGSWIASLFGLGAVFGGLVSALLGNKHGRRTSIMLFAVPDLLGWIMVASSQNLGMMLVGRFLAGFSAAGYSTNIQIYVAELSQPQHRGWLSGLTMPIMAIGVLTMYLVGSWLPWHLAAATCIPVPCLLVYTLFFFWDSPYWYFQLGKDKSALSSLEQFRGKDAHVVSEVFQIQEQMRKVSATVEHGFTDGIKLVWKEKKYLRPFLILNSLFLLMLFSGKFSIEFYAVHIFKDTGAHINEYLAAVIVAFIHLVGSLIFIPLVQRFSRKLLLILSSLVMGVSLILLGFSVYYLNHVKDTLFGFNFIPLISIIAYMLAAPLGLCSIPFMYIAEFYPTEVRSVLGGLTIAISNIELFLVVKTFPNLESLMGEHGVFWLYAGACFGAIIFTLSYIPETKDRPLEQVEDKFVRLRKTARVTPWVSPMPSPNLSNKRNIYNRSQMFTQ